MKLFVNIYQEFMAVFYNLFYRINADHEVFRGYLTHYLSLLGQKDVHQFLHNERLQRQLEFAQYHNYAHNYKGAVFIAGCCYAEYVLKYSHHHQCLSFGQTLADAFMHRHEIETKTKSMIVEEAIGRNGLTSTSKLMRDLNKALTLIIT